MKDKSRISGWRLRLHEIIYEADTPAGKSFDIWLIIAIALSLLAVMLESVPEISKHYGILLRNIEWGFTILFTVEYIFRLICIGRPMRYAGSFFGIVDLAAVLPTYLSLLFPGTHYLLAIRAIRILRVFRVLKLAIYLREGEVIIRALRSSRYKIIVFLFAVMQLVIILGSMMYLVEGPTNGFTSIPKSIYWAIVTLTTVGYGDITPQTIMGQFLASIVMIMGYAIIAVPTGIVTAELTMQHRSGAVSTQVCQSCSLEGHAENAKFCKFCGELL